MKPESTHHRDTESTETDREEKDSPQRTQGNAEEEKRQDIITVLNALASAGLRARGVRELTEQLGMPLSSVSRHVNRLVDTGWARKLEDGFVIGPQVDVAVRRIDEDNAAAVERAHQIYSAVHPQSREEPSAEDFLGLRMLAEVRKDIQALRSELRDSEQRKAGIG